MTQQELARAEVASLLVKKCHLGPTKAVGSVGGRIEPDEGDPLVHQPRILSGAEMTSNGGYCRRASDGSLDVQLKNSTFEAKAPMNVTVEFGTTPPTRNQAISPAIPPIGTVDVMVPIPRACFGPSCSFIIRAYDPKGTVQASGSCLG